MRAALLASLKSLSPASFKVSRFEKLCTSSSILHQSAFQVSPISLEYSLQITSAKHSERKWFRITPPYLHAGVMLRLLSCIFFFLALAHITTPPGLAAASRTGTADVSLECGLHDPLGKLGGCSITCIQWTKTVMDIVSATEVMIGIRCDHENSHRISL